MNEAPSCPCGCYVRGVKLFERKHWKLTRIVDRGSSRLYRFLVEGVNLFSEPGGYGYRIWWELPTLENEQYDTSEATFETSEDAR